MLDVDTFRSSHGTTIELMTPEPQQIPMMIWMDPPEHTWHRKVVNRAFTSKAIGGLEERLTRLCADLLDPFVGSGGGGLFGPFCAPLPPPPPTSPPFLSP